MFWFSQKIDGYRRQMTKQSGYCSENFGTLLKNFGTLLKNIGTLFSLFSEMLLSFLKGRFYNLIPKGVVLL